MEESVPKVWESLSLTNVYYLLGLLRAIPYLRGQSNNSKVFIESVFVRVEDVLKDINIDYKIIDNFLVIDGKVYGEYVDTPEKYLLPNRSVLIKKSFN